LRYFLFLFLSLSIQHQHKKKVAVVNYHKFKELEKDVYKALEIPQIGKIKLN